MKTITRAELELDILTYQQHRAFLLKKLSWYPATHECYICRCDLADNPIIKRDYKKRLLNHCPWCFMDFEKAENSKIKGELK